MTAQFFCVGSRTIQADSCHLVATDNIAKNLNYETGNITQSTTLSLQNVIQSVLLKTKNSSYQLNTQYVNYKDMNGVSFPQEIRLAANSDKTKVSCNFSILNVEFNTNFKLTPTSTEKYTRGNIDRSIGVPTIIILPTNVDSQLFRAATEFMIFHSVVWVKTESGGHQLGL